MTRWEWPRERLKRVADVAFSSVDKKSVDGEVAVKLCNYTDVYYNDDITADLPFMEATATRGQTRSFGLRAGDILITKDSETPDDIGVPAFVPDTLEGVVCGYHLAVLRPRPSQVNPRFLYWVLASQYAREEMAVLASGVTRYGLRFGDVGNLRVFLPSLPEQRAIANFLDRETARIETLVQRKRRLIDLAAERYGISSAQIIIRGTTPTKLRESGVPGLGHVPEHWGVAPLRRTRCEVQTGPFGSQLHAEEYVNDGIPVVNPANLIDGRIIPDGRQAVDETTAVRLSRHRLAIGDVVFGRRGELGRAALVEESQEGWLCGTGCLRIRFPINAFHEPYLKHYLRLPAIRDYFRVMSVGSTMENLNSELLLGMPLLFPPRKEQIEIAEAVQDLDERRKTFAERAGRQIALLLERREAIVTATMKGQADAG